MNLVLIGYRGTGKSEVGKLLAEQLKMDLVSMDAEIVSTSGMRIPDIVEQHGWPKFRDMETEMARTLTNRDNLAIDCGGGVIERPENIVILKRNGTIFWLQASVETIVKRIEGDTERPSLTGAKSFTDEVSEVLEVRTPKYQAAAQFTIDTDNLTPQQVADEILQNWK